MKSNQNMNITQPTLILDKQKCLRNIKRMADKAKKHNLKLRPHFKTHQSGEIGNWVKNFDIDSITVSSVSMAEYFAANGWKDITIAFPFNILEIEKVNNLTKKIKINLLIENIETFIFLNKNLKSKTGFFIKIDTGYHRSGINWDDFEKIDKILESTKKSTKLNFIGFLTHSGQTYHAKSKKEILQIHFDSIKILNFLKEKYIHEFGNIEISIGDTPSCSIAEDFNGVDEIRPGNFILYDLMQYKLGSCSVEDIAVSLACPVVSVNNKRNEIVVYGGGIHLSKEFLIDKNGNKYFGYVVNFQKNNFSLPVKDTFVKSLSQEHGIIKTNPDYISKIKIGDVLGILPVHSCLTVSAMRNYLTFDGKVLGTY
ncbi:MAG: alanine racemase [Bacteroidales bacterium]|nr:alanine racemase [Bacteroidales bacterium]